MSSKTSLCFFGPKGLILVAKYLVMHECILQAMWFLSILLSPENLSVSIQIVRFIQGRTRVILEITENFTGIFETETRDANHSWELADESVQSNSAAEPRAVSGQTYCSSRVNSVFVSRSLSSGELTRSIYGPSDPVGQF